MLRRPNHLKALSYRLSHKNKILIMNIGSIFIYSQSRYFLLIFSPLIRKIILISISWKFTLTNYHTKNFFPIGRLYLYCFIQSLDKRLCCHLLRSYYEIKVLFIPLKFIQHKQIIHIFKLALQMMFIEICQIKLWYLICSLYFFIFIFFN